MATSPPILRRKSSLAAAKRISVQLQSEPDEEHERIVKHVRPATPSFEDASDATSDAPPSEPEPVEEQRPAKRRKTAKTARNHTGNADLHQRLFGNGPVHANADPAPCPPPARTHPLTYHRPLLLDGTTGREARASLLTWFDSVSSARAMPWRKPWLDTRGVDPDEARRLLERRAYEVWISEIMLQQTRVAVVIGYWTKWMAAWPTIQDLAAADADAVLAMWRGLGYYSRATRIHEAARLVVGDGAMRGLLPDGVGELAAKVPGVGRYTAGAISAIVFGRAAPMVDGNVLRVLSRQLGVYGDVKTEKAVIDLLWAAASALVKAVAGDGEGAEMDDGKDASAEPPISDRPGRWGQTLMELGSTVCTPKPNCSACPVTTTCRAYAEGSARTATKIKHGSQPAVDMEDLCTLCQPFEDEDEETPVLEAASKNPRTKAKQLTLSSFAFTPKSGRKEAKTAPGTAKTDAEMEIIVNHAKKFPVKTIKKAVRQEEIVVCALQRSDGQYLIQRRPQKGLLAGLWEFPSKDLPSAKERSAKARKDIAKSFISGVVSDKGAVGRSLQHHGELGSVPWLFSHIKLTMHVHLFTLETTPALDEVSLSSDEQRPMRWSDTIEDESMGTGMRKCLALVQRAQV